MNINTPTSNSQALLTAEYGKNRHLGIWGYLKKILEDFRYENAAFLVTCLYLIYEYNRLHLIYPSLDVIPWGKTLLLLGIIFAFLDQTCKTPPAAAVWSMLMFSACVILSMLFAYSTQVATTKWIDFFGWVFVVFLITSVVNTRTRLYLFVCVYFLANLKMAQHGFRVWANAGFGFSSYGASGSPGWFQNPGEFSMQMGIFLPMILAYIHTFRVDWSRGVQLFFYLLAIMAAGSIIASNARAGILGLGMVLIWLFFYSRQRIKTLFIVVLAMIVVYVAMPDEFKQRFETAGEDKTSISRLMYWERGKEAVRDNPLTGIGFKNWTVWVADNHPDLVGFIGGKDRIEVIHNTYLEAATELGYPGAFVYGFILLYIFMANRQSARIAFKKNDRLLAATANGLNGSLFVYLGPSFFMSVLYYPYIWIILAFTVCVSSISSNPKQKYNNIRSTKSPFSPYHSIPKDMK